MILSFLAIVFVGCSYYVIHACDNCDSPQVRAITGQSSLERKAIDTLINSDFNWQRNQLQNGVNGLQTNIAIENISPYTLQLQHFVNPAHGDVFKFKPSINSNIGPREKSQFTMQPNNYVDLKQILSGAVVYRAFSANGTAKCDVIFAWHAQLWRNIAKVTCVSVQEQTNIFSELREIGSSPSVDELKQIVGSLASGASNNEIAPVRANLASDPLIFSFASSSKPGRRTVYRFQFIGTDLATTNASPIATNQVEECSICMERDAVSALIPCGHQKYCQECAIDIVNTTNFDKLCPVCRKPVHGCLRVYH